MSLRASIEALHTPLQFYGTGP